MPRRGGDDGVAVYCSENFRYHHHAATLLARKLHRGVDVQLVAADRGARHHRNRAGCGRESLGSPLAQRQSIWTFLALAPAQRGKTLRQDRSEQLPEGIVGGIAREHAKAAQAGNLLRSRGQRQRRGAGDKAKKSSSLHLPLKSPPPAIADMP